MTALDDLKRTLGLTPPPVYYTPPIRHPSTPAPLPPTHPLPPPTYSGGGVGWSPPPIVRGEVVYAPRQPLPEPQPTQEQPIIAGYRGGPEAHITPIGKLPPPLKQEQPKQSIYRPPQQEYQRTMTAEETPKKSPEIPRGIYRAATPEEKTQSLFQNILPFAEERGRFATQIIESPETQNPILEFGKGSIASIIELPEQAVGFGASLRTKPIETILSVPETAIFSFESPRKFGEFWGLPIISYGVGAKFLKSQPEIIPLSKPKITQTLTLTKAESYGGIAGETELFRGIGKIETGIRTTTLKKIIKTDVSFEQIISKKSQTEISGISKGLITTEGDTKAFVISGKMEQQFPEVPAVSLEKAKIFKIENAGRKI